MRLAVWDHVSRVGTHVEGRAGDWALALQVRLLLEVDRVDEAEALLAAWSATCPAATGTTSTACRRNT